jgi:hypothetical protein
MYAYSGKEEVPDMAIAPQQSALPDRTYWAKPPPIPSSTSSRYQGSREQNNVLLLNCSQPYQTLLRQRPDPLATISIAASLQAGDQIPEERERWSSRARDQYCLVCLYKFRQ